jgi:phage-related minor tail protein
MSNNVVEFPTVEREVSEDEVDKLHADAFRDLEGRIDDCAIMAKIATEMAARAIEGRDDKHETAMFAVFQVAAMLKKLKADYQAMWHGEQT